MAEEIEKILELVKPPAAQLSAEPTLPDDFERARPVCGVLSVVSPFGGLVLIRMICGFARQMETGYDYRVVIMPIAVLVGTILAIVGLRRRESCRALPVLGLVFNLGLLLLGLIVVIKGK